VTISAVVGGARPCALEMNHPGNREENHRFVRARHSRKNAQPLQFDLHGLMLTQNPDHCIIKLWKDIPGEAKMNDLYRRILAIEAPGGQPAWVQIVAPTVMLPVPPERRRGPALSG